MKCAKKISNYAAQKENNKIKKFYWQYGGYAVRIINTEEKESVPVPTEIFFAAI